MGFFSKLKKLWNVDETLDQAVEEYKVEKGIAEEEAPAVPEQPEEPVEPETAAPESESKAEPEATAVETAPEEAAPVEEPAEEIILSAEPEELPVSPEEEPVAEETAVLEVPSPEAEPVSAAPTPFAPAPVPEAVIPSEAPTAVEAGWQQELLLTLREAEPRLSVWLDLILEGVEEAGDDLWERLAFLFKALEAPEDESKVFIDRFRVWLEDMEYERVSEFRSELQYRLALALDLEDEEDERSRLFLKLSEGLEKTKETITRRIEGLLSAHEKIDEEFWEELEEILIMADVGYEPAIKLVEKLRERVRKSGSNDPAQFKELMREELEELFKTPKRITAVNPPEVVMMVGVNGVGKTTTIGKLAHRAQLQGRKVLIAAGDTFRAAAIEQLEVWAKRVGAGFYTKGENSDPAAVAYEAIDYALANGYDLVLLDTAGRLHTKVNLMEELKKIERVCGKKHPGAPHRSILVVDATTGQNAMSQTKLFNEAVGVDEIVLTKLDGTSKGGIVVAIAIEYGIPITFVGLGEKMEDLRPFDGRDFAQALLM